MLGRLVKNVVQDPRWGQWAVGDDDTGANTGAGMRVTQRTSLQLLAVYGCVREIAQTIATMPLDQLRLTPQGRRPASQRAAWLDQPSKSVDRVTFTWQLLTSLLLDGNAFVQPSRDPTGVTYAARVLDPKAVQVRDDGGSLLYTVAGVPLRGELLHIRGFAMPGEARGLSPIEQARQSVGLGMAVTEYGARFFGNGTSLSGVIEHPGAPGPDEVKIMRSTWAKHHQGPRKAFLPGILTGGATWKPVSITADQAQFLETRGFQSAEIATFMFGIDPAMFGLSQASGGTITYQNIETRWIDFVRRACMPWMTRVELMYEALLPGKQYAKFNADAYLRADTKTRYEAYEIAAQNHFLTNPEIRELEDRPPIDGEPLFPPAKPKPPTQGGANA